MDFERKTTIYPSQKATSKNDDDNEIKKEKPKGDGYIVGSYLRQRVENL